MFQRKNVVTHLASVGLLLLGFVLCRYVFFEFHGMGQFPVIVLVIGLIAMSVSFLVTAKIVPFGIASAYLMAFAIGAIFQEDGFDPGGGGTNSLWKIWLVVFVTLIFASMIAELVHSLLKRIPQKA